MYDSYNVVTRDTTRETKATVVVDKKQKMIRDDKEGLKFYKLQRIIRKVR